MTENLKTNLPSVAYIGLKDIPLVTHQSRIRCGYYTAEWIARAIGLHPKPANEIIRGPLWFDIFRPVLPRDMMAIFKFRGMDSVQVDLSKFSVSERANWIKNEVTIKRKPPSILIRKKPLHWIAIGGYDDEKKIFYIYDSSFGLNSTNPNLPIGNSTIKYEDLDKLWTGGWFLNYRAIVINTDNLN